jgi:hypothetical protein
MRARGSVEQNFLRVHPPSSFLSPRETLGWCLSQAAAAAAAAATAASQCSFVTKLKKTLFYHHNLFVFVR